MAELAKIDLAIAPACPNCRQRILDMDLDKVADGAEHQCLFCGHCMKVPKSILDRLLVQRDAARAAGATQGKGSMLARLAAFFSQLLSRR